jgi:hypothetical protein
MEKPHFIKLLVILFLMTSLFSCERLSELYRLSDTSGTKVVTGDDETGDETPEDQCWEPVIIRLLSTGNLENSPGNVTVTNDGEFLSVKFDVTEGDWNFDMIYLEVGPLDFVPLEETSTYPAFWEFNHQYNDIAVASYDFQISLAELDDCFVILAQARIINSEGSKIVMWTEGINPGWSEGPFYIDYCKDNCIEPCDDCKDPCDDCKDPCEDCKEPCDDCKEPCDDCKEPCDGCKMGIYRTQTPGGWGAKAAGNNPGTYRDANFDAVFEDGLKVGLDKPDHHILLTSSMAIQKLLPTGGKPAVLKESYKDPTDIKNVLVGHIVALSLSIGFDDYDEDFGKADGSLKKLIIADGHGFDGMTVGDILDEANIVLGGGSSSYSPSQMTEILTKINEYFVDGKQSEKYKLFDCK